MKRYYLNRIVVAQNLRVFKPYKASILVYHAFSNSAVAYFYNKNQFGKIQQKIKQLHKYPL